MKIISEKNFITAFLLITILLLLMVPISAYQIASGTGSLSTNAGTATIRGGLYTTSGRPEPYNADTTTSISIGTGRTTEIKARINNSPAVSETRSGYTVVNAYGYTAGSAHDAYSSIDSEGFNLA